MYDLIASLGFNKWVYLVRYNRRTIKQFDTWKEANDFLTLCKLEDKEREWFLGERLNPFK